MRNDKDVAAPEDADERRSKPATIVYSVGQLPPFDAAFYEAARDGIEKVSELTVAPRDAGAFHVPKGHFFRIVSMDGPQVGDLNLWNAHDYSERFFSGKTRALHATHVTTGDRLWSTLPFLRPMATITHDTHGMADVIHQALRMPAGEQRDRMRLMRNLVRQCDVHRWAAQMLLDAAQLRRRERIMAG
jgi:uncharacterized protein YcgI (DUF1989 family)